MLTPSACPPDPIPSLLQWSNCTCQLRSSELATSSSSTISHNLAGLKDLYECVEDFLLLQSNQHEKCVDGFLDRSLMLLDFCGTTRDALSQVKQCVQDLQSSIHRRSDLANELNEYMTSRKKVTKAIRKCFSGLKKMQNKNCEDVAVVSVVREVEATTLAVFESLLSFLSGPKARSKPNRWSLVSKLMPNKPVACQGETNEVEKVDMALNALIVLKQKKIVWDVKNAQNQLEALEMIIQDLVEGLEGAFRGLIKTRVSLLNILNN